MSETGGLKAIEVPSFCWLSSNCNKINEKSIEVWNFNKARDRRGMRGRSGRRVVGIN